MMKEKKPLILYRIAKWASVFLLALCIIIAGYIFVVVKELRLKIDEAKIVKSAVTQEQSFLEADTKVNLQDFKDFLVFTTQGKSEKFIEENLLNSSFTISKNDLFVNSEVLLPSVEANSCLRFRCIQVKKRFSEIPSLIWKGLLGTEDYRFLEHQGVDPIAIGRAIVVDLLAMKFVQGGSTLTQQLVKNMFLTNEKKISRKIKEMIFALYIDYTLNKEEIINLYLNEVYWGSFQGMYIKGFYAASLAYFGKAPNYLDDYEATILISLLKGPGFYRPSRKIQRLQSRVDSVFTRLQGLNLVTQDDAIRWSSDRWEKYSQEFTARNKRTDFYSYYQLSKNVETNLEPYEKFVLYNSVIRNRIRLKERTKDADIAVKILVGQKACEGYDCKGIFSYYSKLEREKRKAITGEYHQVGSLFKPVVYDTFIELGRSYDEEVSTAPITLDLKSGKWTPKDYSKAKIQTIQLKRALQKSKNIPLIRVASEVGFDKLEEKLIARIPRLQTPLAEYPAQLLGAIELSVEEVFQVYNKFIKDKCKVIRENNLNMEDTILFYMSVAAETTISRIARPPLKNAYIFGKTGTTNNGLDNWYFAYDGKEVYVIWFGVDSDRNKHDLRISGASTAFMIFQDFINNRGKQISEILCD